MCNVYARMNCTSSIDTVVKFLDYRSSLKKSAYKIGLIPIISQYARKVLFSGVFYISSIFQDGGMVMDENGRNGGNWHLAQQITYHVTLYIFQQLAQHVIIQKNNNKPHSLMHILFITIIVTQIWRGDFYFSYKYQKISPVSNYNNLQFVNK